MATSGKIQPGDEVEAYYGDGGLVLGVGCYGQDVIVHHTGTYPKVWAARELKVVRRGAFDVRELGAAEQNPVGWSVDEWNGLRWAYQARGRKAQGAPKEQAPLGDWKRGESGEWHRRRESGDDVYVNDNAEPGVFRALVCGTLLGERFACPDAAREAADAHLVSQGRLDKSRAFVRLGEWEEDGVSYYRTKGGTPWHHASMAFAINDLDRARKDAELVASGALDPSRAFKATTENTPNTMTRFPPQMHNSVPPEVARAAKPYTIPTGYSPDHVASRINADPNAPVTATVRHGAISLEQRAVGPARPAWGDWERVGNMYLRAAPNGRTSAYADGDTWVVRRGLLAEERAFKVAAKAVGVAVGHDAANGRDVSATVVVNKRADGVNEIVGYAQDTAKVSDDEINAMYGKHSEVARALIGAKRQETRTVVHTVKNHGETVTLADWEHHLPALLDGAPREFRDGFNRRQGPAWEAYLVALAGVKEQIQTRKLLRPATAECVTKVATFRAHEHLGAEWVKANVR